MRTLFARIAPRYDLVNSLMSLGLDRKWRKEAAFWANFSTTTLALDLATGTGELALALAQGNAQVMGVDLSPEMMKLGREKALRLGKGDQINFLFGDALCLPFPDNTFDIATLGYALRDLENIPLSLAELRRVLKKGGKLVCLELTLPRSPLFRSLFALYLQKIIPILGRFFGKDGDAYAFLARSLHLYPTAKELQEMRERVGLRQVSYHLYGLGTVALHQAVK